MGIAGAVAAVLLLAALACGGLAMASARRDAVRRRHGVGAPPHPSVPHPHPHQHAAPSLLHPLHELNRRLRTEADPRARIELAMQLARMGGAQAALLTVAAVRDGVIAPTAGAQAVWHTGFDGGVIAGVALHDPDPRVQAFARMVLDGAVQPR